MYWNNVGYFHWWMYYTNIIVLIKVEDQEIKCADCYIQRNKLLRAIRLFLHVFLGWSRLGWRIFYRFHCLCEGNLRPLKNKELHMMLDGATASACSAMYHYIHKWNPNIVIMTQPHSAGALRGFKGPKLVISRHLPDIYCSRFQRKRKLWKNHFIIWASCFLEKLRIVIWYAMVPFEDCVVAKYEDVIVDPRFALREINNRFGLKLNVGDGIFPRLNTYEQWKQINKL